MDISNWGTPYLKCQCYSSKAKILQNLIIGQPQPMVVKMVPLHNNLDLENGWQTSICHPSDTHQEQTAEKISPFIFTFGM